jgi:hypothetical protein
MDVRTGQQADDRTEWVSGGEARRITGFSWGRLTRNAMLGRISVQLLPGIAPRYSRADLVALSRPVPQAVGA